MAQDSMTADELKREIEEAFADVPYPGDDQLEEPYPSDVGGMEVFRGCRWQDWKDKPWECKTNCVNEVW